MSDAKSLRVAYGEALVELGARHDRVVVLDADLAHATMTSMFEAKYPDRFFNFGLAEANMMCAAAGFAHSGLVPFASTFALFGAGRAYEQIRNSIAYVNANVKFGLSHSGLSVGEDGGSHQSVEDIALMRVVPNMTIFVPCDPIETKKAVFAAVEIDGPVYIRVARPVVETLTSLDTPFIPGKANIMREGSDVCIVATGLMVRDALKAAEVLKAEGISASVVNVHTIKPFDEACILEMAKACGAIVSVEEHSIIGGLGSAVAETLAGRSDAKFRRMGIRDMFGVSGKPADLFEKYGLTADHIVSECRALLSKEGSRK
jgi:transketolase